LHVFQDQRQPKFTGDTTSALFWPVKDLAELRTVAIRKMVLKAVYSRLSDMNPTLLIRFRRKGKVAAGSSVDRKADDLEHDSQSRYDEWEVLVKQKEQKQSALADLKNEETKKETDMNEARDENEYDKTKGYSSIVGLFKEQQLLHIGTRGSSLECLCKGSSFLSGLGSFNVTATLGLKPLKAQESLSIIEANASVFDTQLDSQRSAEDKFVRSRRSREHSDNELKLGQEQVDKLLDEIDLVRRKRAALIGQDMLNDLYSEICDKNHYPGGESVKFPESYTILNAQSAQTLPAHLKGKWVDTQSSYGGCRISDLAANLAISLGTFEMENTSENQCIGELSSLEQDLGKLKEKSAKLTQTKTDAQVEYDSAKTIKDGLVRQIGDVKNNTKKPLGIAQQELKAGDIKAEIDACNRKIGKRKLEIKAKSMDGKGKS
jgi:hypothetical protein